MICAKLHMLLLITLPWAALKHRIRNPETETESRKRKRKRKRNTESSINDRKLKYFTSIQREFVLIFFTVPLNIFLLLCLDKVCRSEGHCTARPMKVILRLILFTSLWVG